MPYRVVLHTEEGVVCVVHMFRAKYFSVFFFWRARSGGLWEIHLCPLATCGIAVATRDVGKLSHFVSVTGGGG